MQALAEGGRGGCAGLTRPWEAGVVHGCILGVSGGAMLHWKVADEHGVRRWNLLSSHFLLKHAFWHPLLLLRHTAFLGCFPG